MPDEYSVDEAVEVNVGHPRVSDRWVPAVVVTSDAVSVTVRNDGQGTAQFARAKVRKVAAPDSP